MSTDLAAFAKSVVQAAATQLADRTEEVDRLNVFPVPDGDTGTNMSLTMQSVMTALAELPDDTDLATLCHAVTHGSLLGARGNSGVILSQILRGLCDPVGKAESVGPDLLVQALDRATDVAFGAVRKPVEGTMLTVLRDVRDAVRERASDSPTITDLLDAASRAGFDSVERTPELLPVLKENGVVDAGGYGLALLFEGFAAAVAGRAVLTPVPSAHAPEPRVVPTDDWDDDEYLYCTEFLLFGDGLDAPSISEFVQGVGGSELVVGAEDMLKIHVHTDDPGSVLMHMTSLGEVAEVHINNMRRQTAARTQAIASESTASSVAPRKPLGVVAVAVGEGLERILQSLGVDVIVSGGQTMNPSTKDILEAITAANADSVLILPNNRNIQLAAVQAVDLSSAPAVVIPSESVPQAFSAMLAFDPGASLDENADAMREAIASVRTGEITTAVKDAVGKSGPVDEGDVIGIVDHDIIAVGTSVQEVCLAVLDRIVQDASAVTLLAGSEMDDASAEAIREAAEARFPDAEVSLHRGEQPLYPMIVSAE